jgi:hypothetical protein
LGKAGFVVVLVGLAIAGSVGEFWVFTEQPYRVAGGRDASWTIYLLGHLILAIGSVLFGIATVRAGILPRTAAMLFAMLGAAAVVPVAGAMLFAIPFIWLGYALWSGGYATMRQPASVE